jgi:hypothetical protein
MIDRAQERLNELDRRGYQVLEAIRHAGGHSSSYSAPNQLVAIDGRTYWVKGHVQQGLVAELVAGRLARRSGAGPEAAILHVTREVAEEGQIPTDQLGLVVGSRDEPNTVNARDFGNLAPDLSFRATGIDGPSRARVIAFQTWLGVGDAQVLVRLTDGHVMSIDHGDAFGATASQDRPTLIVADIPGVPPEVGRRKGDVMVAVNQIQSISDMDLINDVARVPAGAAWRSPATRRLEIAEYLASRRDQLEEVMSEWLQTL